MSLSDASAQSWQWNFRGREFDLRQKTLVMGVLNLTPDSFSDGGRFDSPDRAMEHAVGMIEDGADIVDIGAESTRPGQSGNLTDEEEWNRLEPVISQLRREFPRIVISIDTYRGATAERALDAGADVINDIYALRKSPKIAGMCARHNAGLVVMHMQGDPATMQVNPTYNNVLAEIRDELQAALDTATAAGLPEQNIAIDPGIGFGKTVDHNVEILAGLEYLRLMQRPICIGASRKSFLGHLTGGLGIGDREEATIAVHCAAVMQGATIIRTHNVKAAVRSLGVIDAIRRHADM